MTRFSHASSGIFPRVMPGQRMQKIVAMILIAVPMLPKPETSKRQGPEIGAVAGRERARGQRRISPPTNVRGIARRHKAHCRPIS